MKFVQMMPHCKGHIGLYNILFSEFGHVAYQIKGNEAYKTC